MLQTSWHLRRQHTSLTGCEFRNMMTQLYDCKHSQCHCPGEEKKKKKHTWLWGGHHVALTWSRWGSCLHVYNHQSLHIIDSCGLSASIDRSQVAVYFQSYHCEIMQKPWWLSPACLLASKLMVTSWVGTQAGAEFTLTTHTGHDNRFITHETSR